MLREPLLSRCPKSGRIVGGRLFPLVGILAVGWFLVRVIPKPSRAEYPCQRVAAGVAAGFITWLVSVLAGYSVWRLLRQRCGQAVTVALLLALAVAGYHTAAISQSSSVTPVLAPREGPNHPMGKAQGIFPGRVVWEQDFAATRWDGQTGKWWEDAGIDQPTVDRMFSKTLQGLTGATTDKQAWDMLFRHFNRTAGRGDRGYRPGERVVVKLNCNAEDGKPWGVKGYPAPHVVNTLVRQLIETAGVPGSAIVLTDPSRGVGDPIYSKVRGNLARGYQEIAFEGERLPDGPQRVKPEPDLNSPMHFRMPGDKQLTLYPPLSYTNATYLINYALFRPHRVFGVTIAAKNHFGSVYDPEFKSFTPRALHAFALWEYPTPNHHGEAHSHPVLLGHKLTGGKTLLYFVDGLYTSYNQGREVVRWKTLDGRWFSSLLMSQDPVALDSVAYDLITSEPNLVTGNPSFNGNVDSYLHEAALAANPPSKTPYAGLASLGVHEHWNGPVQKQYSRNLGRKEGIELLALK